MQHERKETAPGTRREFMRMASAGGAAAGMAALGAAGADAPPVPPAQHRPATICLVQLTSGSGPGDAVDRMGPFFEEAADRHADLIVFPEYILGRNITVEDANVQRFLALAARHRMYAVAGLVEQFGASYTTTALVTGRDGSILGRYFKCHPAAGGGPFCWPPVPGTDGEALGVLGNQFKVFALDFGTIGILQCYDGYFPEAWGCTSFAGAEIILWINGRNDRVEDAHCIFNAQAFGCVVGANISDGWNTGFAAPRWSGCLSAEGKPEDEMLLYPRIPHAGDAAVFATIDMRRLRRHRKHLRYMHQRRPELYGLLTRDVKVWQDYPDIPWGPPEAADYVNRSQL